MMKRTKSMLVALVAAGLWFVGTTVGAQQPKMGMGDMPMGSGMMGMMRDCPMMGPMMGMPMGADTATHSVGRIAFLKAELGITDSQKAVWEAYAAALSKNLQGMQAMRDTMMKVMAAKSPVERLDAHLAAMEARLASLKEMKPAVAALYAGLGDEQKRKADQVLTGMSCMM